LIKETEEGGPQYNRSSESSKETSSDDGPQYGRSLESSKETSSSEDEKETVKKRFIIKKLFTHEDKFNVHKTFGLLSLLSYVYRYLYMMPLTGTLGIDHGLFSYVTLLIHTCLSCSSLVFHVLAMRIIENPLIIYEEYRIHAILFTLRGILVSLFGLHMYLTPEEYRRYALPLMVCFVHILVDLVTMKHGKKGVTAVRHEGKSTGAIRFGKYVYSFYQFAALGGHLIVHDSLSDLGFNTIIAIQSSAFLMTLKRKNLIDWSTHAIWYTLCLVISMYYMWIAKGGIFFLHVLLAFLGRTYFDMNKYVVWMIYTVSINIVY